MSMMRGFVYFLLALADPDRFRPREIPHREFCPPHSLPGGQERSD